MCLINSQFKILVEAELGIGIGKLGGRVVLIYSSEVGFPFGYRQISIVCKPLFLQG